MHLSFGKEREIFERGTGRFGQPSPQKYIISCVGHVLCSKRMICKQSRLINLMLEEIKGRNPS